MQEAFISIISLKVELYTVHTVGNVTLFNKVNIVLEGQWKMLESVVSEIECVKTTVNDLVNIESGKVPPPPPASRSSSSQSYANAAAASRRTLPQSSLDDLSPWTVVNNRKSRGNNVATPEDNDDDDIIHLPSHPQSSKPEIDPFTSAVRDAERSVLIHNLNLGNSPTLNPNTISARVTSALVTAISAADEGTNGHPSSTGKEITADIMSLVQSMDLYGNGTRPCRVPGNPSLNGTYYTVPVKLTFQNKQTAQRVSEVLRSRFKVNISVPYHRSLRAAMNLVREKVKSSNPGMMVIVNLEFAARSLEAKIRPEGAGPSSGQWTPLPKKFPLPAEALNPKLREVSTISLPASPTKPSGFDDSDDDSMECHDHSSLHANPKGKTGTIPKGSTPSVLSSSPPPKKSALPRMPPPVSKANTGKQP
jgi:hypothetical protein